MRLLAVLLLLAALPAAAQQPQIFAISADQFVSWTNPNTNNYFATDWTWNLNYTWIQPDSIAHATQTVMHTHIWQVDDIGAGPDFGVLPYHAAALGDNTDAMFVRIRTSPEPLACGRVTNWLSVCNASTSALENVTFGIESGLGNRGSWTTNVTLLLPGSVTAPHEFSFNWPAIFHPFGPEYTPGCYYITYDQDGLARDYSLSGVMPVGPPRKDVVITISNNSWTVSFDWLPGQITGTYE